MTNRIMVKDWFRNKLKEVNNYSPFRYIERIIKETEKAYYVEIEYSRCDGESEIFVEQWIPKSVVITEEEEKAEEKKQEERMQAGFEKYMELYNWALAQGIKVRKKSTTATILKKIEEAGMSYNN